MADVVITHAPGITVEVIPGDPPTGADPELQQRITELEALVVQLTAERDDALLLAKNRAESLVGLQAKVDAFNAGFNGLRP